MASLLELPPELLVDILSRLEPVHKKQFRQASKQCEQLATPLVFNEVMFDLDPGGCDGLASIANSPLLSRQVRTIRLQRRAGLREFGDFESWCESNVHEYVPWFTYENEVTSISHATKPMSEIEWDDLDENEREALYYEYLSDVDEIEAYIARLASATSAVLVHDWTSATKLHDRPSDAQRNLNAFMSAIRTLPNIHTLEYTPAYENNDWGRTWRNIEFHPDALAECSEYGVDPDIDALQLFIALWNVLRAPNALRFVEIFTLGHAFWGTPQLFRLLDWSFQSPSYAQLFQETVRETVERWTVEIDDPLAVMEHTETLTRLLLAIERGCSRLTTLHCRVNTLWFSEPEGLVTPAKTVSSILQAAVKLEQLELIYRNDAFVDDIGAFEVGPTLLEEEVEEQVMVSKHLLLNSASALGHLRRLYLSLATVVPHLLHLFAHLHQLRHLKLYHVTLLHGGGQWETVLTWLAEHIRLDTVELRSLNDVCDQGSRLILCLESPEWTAGTINDFYDEYRNSIVRYTLGQSNSLPTLSPAEFLAHQSKS